MRIHVEYAPTIAEYLRNASKKLSNLTPLLKAIGNRVRYGMQQNIGQSRTPEGQAYKPLSRPRKSGHDQRNIPLYDKGTLFRAIRYEPVEPIFEVAIGEDTSYGIYQSRGSHHVPARPFVGFRQDDLDAISHTLEGFSVWAFGGGPEGSAIAYTTSAELIGAGIY